MKRRIALSLALVLSVVLLSLVRSDSTAKAQQRRIRFAANTGVLTLGQNQILRLTINWGDGSTQAVVRFKRTGYTEQDNIYRVASQVTTDLIMLAPNEGASFDTGVEDLPSPSSGVRVDVFSTSPRVQVNILILNAITGEIVACSIPTGTVTF